MRRRIILGVSSLVAAGISAVAAVPMLGASPGPHNAVRPAAASSFKRHPLGFAGEAGAYSRFLDAAAFTQALNAAAQQATRRSSGGGGGARCQDGALEYGDGTYSIPSDVVMRESGGWYGSCNESSGACGAYQVLPSTWAGYGGYSSACDAPPAVQDQWAAEAYAQAGCDPWGGC